ncbi:hypothetical protein [Halotalea alkalilenta]|uniref:hypothetical protein n=1 Tax=Halotalea alkalilenta TaxID=376489 RepID=UPI0012DC7AD7|nr:hypothetical protein [Halotalea alkalilenta]
MEAHVGIGVSLLLSTTVLLVLVLLRSGDEAKYGALRLRADPGEGGLGVIVVVLWNMCFFMDMSIEITPKDRTQRFFYRRRLLVHRPVGAEGHFVEIARPCPAPPTLSAPTTTPRCVSPRPLPIPHHP